MPIILVFSGGGVGEGSGAQRHSQMHSRFVVSVIIRDCIRKEVERKGRWGGGEKRGREKKGVPSSWHFLLVENVSIVLS